MLMRVDAKISRFNACLMRVSGEFQRSAPITDAGTPNFGVSVKKGQTHKVGDGVYTI